LFGEPGQDFFVSWANFIIFIALLAIGLWIYSLVVRTKTAESISKSFGKRYSTLPFGVKKFLRVFAFIVYCAASYAFIIYISS
jgi:hypothetical protein